MQVGRYLILNAYCKLGPAEHTPGRKWVRPAGWLPILFHDDEDTQWNKDELRSKTWAERLPSKYQPLMTAPSIDFQYWGRVLKPRSSQFLSSLIFRTSIDLHQAFNTPTYIKMTFLASAAGKLMTLRLPRIRSLLDWYRDYIHVTNTADSWIYEDGPPVLEMTERMGWEIWGLMAPNHKEFYTMDKLGRLDGMDGVSPIWRFLSRTYITTWINKIVADECHEYLDNQDCGRWMSQIRG